MSSLSKGNLNEIANLYSGITVKESAEPQQDPQVDVDLSEEVLTEEVILEDSTFIFQLVGSHLIENKMADSEESAIKIMENMGDAWAVEILATYFSDHEDLHEAGGEIRRRAMGYLKGTISPIIKKRLNISPNQGLMSGIAKKVIEKGADKGTQLVKDVVQGGIGGTVDSGYKQVRAVGKNLRKFVPGALTLGAGSAAVNDLMKGDKSWLRGLFKPDYSNAPR
jgi:hypothetical protein